VNDMNDMNDMTGSFIPIFSFFLFPFFLSIATIYLLLTNRNMFGTEMYFYSVTV